MGVVVVVVAASGAIVVPGVVVVVVVSVALFRGCLGVRGGFWGVWGIQISIKATGQIFPKILVPLAPKWSNLVHLRFQGQKTGQKMPKLVKNGQKWVWTNGHFLKKHTL